MMRDICCCLTLLLFICVATDCFAQESKLERDDFVSDASFVVGTYDPESAEYSPKRAAETANKFLKTLDEELRKRASHKLDSAERRQWTNLPVRRNAGGVRLGDLKRTQLEAACNLLRAVMSEAGYEKMRNIMLADDQLLDEGRRRPGFGTEDFSIVIFGSPSEKSKWAVQLDGHHVGVNISIEESRLTLSPSFIGTQPSKFKLGDKRFDRSKVKFQLHTSW